MFFTKPLLLPFLAAYYTASVKSKWNNVHKIMLLAFLFSWFGDISLMLTPETISDTHLMGIPKSKYFFLLGLGSFLITQLLFIRAFRNAVSSAKNTVSTIGYLPFLFYWAAMMFVVLPPLYANQEKNAAIIPVVVYAAILVSMAATALNRYKNTAPESFTYTFIGACLFVISDSLIAINFLALKEPMYHAGFLIMTTYMAAEFLIAYGILEHFKEQ
ncbi:MAG: lysoplasmalogenase [Chitinophagales bacterium]|nr:lysoplasmalogenase [Chitinophagales bacterium]